MCYLHSELRKYDIHSTPFCLCQQIYRLSVLTQNISTFKINGVSNVFIYAQASNIWVVFFGFSTKDAVTFSSTHLSFRKKVDGSRIASATKRVNKKWPTSYHWRSFNTIIQAFAKLFFWRFISITPNYRNKCSSLFDYFKKTTMLSQEVNEVLLHTIYVVCML